MKTSNYTTKPLSSLTRCVIAIAITVALVSVLLLVSVAAPQESKPGNGDSAGVRSLPVVRTAEIPSEEPPTHDFEGHTIAEVHIVGNHRVPETTILPQITIQTGKALSSRQLDIDDARISALGFFPSVEHQVTQNLKDPTRVNVTFKVIENRVIRAFWFVGVTRFTANELEKVLKSQKGNILNDNLIGQDVIAIQRLYREKNYAAVVTETRQLENGIMVFRVQEASISRIELSGLEKVSPDVVRKQILTKSGGLFDQAKIRADLERIYDTGLFEETSFKVSADPDKPGSLVLNIVLKEKNTR